MMSVHKAGRPSGACNIKPTNDERNLIMRRLKSKAVNGDSTAALALVQWLALEKLEN